MVAGVVAMPLPLRAHIGHEITRGERYIKLDVAGRAARVVVSLTLGAAEGARVLGAADADDDGSVSERERDAYLAQWAEGLRAELPVTVDGVPVELQWGEPFMDPIGPVASVPTSVEMVARFELGGGRQAIRITDAMVRREVYDRTDVAFRARDEATLIASGVEGDAERATPDLAYGAELGAGRPLVLTAIVDTPARPWEPPWVPIAAAVGALAAAGLVVHVVRSRRKR